MAKGNEIFLNGMFGHGRYMPLINGTGGDLYPGTIVQVDYTDAIDGGVFTAVDYNADIDGGRPKGAHVVVLDTMQKMVGRLMTDAIPTLEMFQGYAPIAGDELNLLWADVSGTGTTDVIAIGTVGIVQDTTGEIIATTGSPEAEVCIARERIALSGDSLIWCEWTGH